MGSTAPLPHTGHDLDSREQIVELVTRFYRQIAQDERFHHWFATIADVDWHAHVAELTDYWTALLLDESSHRPADDVIEAHRWLHDADPFDTDLFERWLEIFDTTLDAGWSGPLTEAARHRGHGIAWAMAKRLTGTANRKLP